MAKGWWDEDRSFGEIIALLHSEASEALEDYRNGRAITEVWYENKELKTRLHYPLTPNCKPCGIPSELADIVIRVFDACERCGIDLSKQSQKRWHTTQHVLSVTVVGPINRLEENG
ncbi:nucleoside triphosphate pyrophosphohydrolase family protein [Paenibacillus sp. JCM 10914]